MRNISSIKEVYATAIVDIAKKYKIEQKILSDLQLINECFTQAPELLIYLSLPSFDRSKKLKIIESVFEGRIEHLTIKIIKLLINKSRLSLLSELYYAVKKELEESASIIKVVLTSAIPLDDELKEAYKNKIKKIFNREPDIEYLIDKNIIGGCKIKVDEKIIDCSIATELNKLRKKLIEN